MERAQRCGPDELLHDQAVRDVVEAGRTISSSSLKSESMSTQSTPGK